MNYISINTDNIRKASAALRAGDRVYLSGTVYTARDAAHKRIIELINKGETLPFNIKDACIYYAGPTPAPKGLAVGACGPTTSGRMDAYTPKLLDIGLAAMIGKGERSREVCRAIARNKAVYFCFVGGAGALASSCIRESEIVAFEDLGCEAIRKLRVVNLPLIVAVDSDNGNIFDRNAGKLL